MRFITWPTLTNAVFIFTVILPFLISTVNGITGLLIFVSPSQAGLYFAGQEYEIIWKYTVLDGSSVKNGVCNLYLVDMNAGPNQTLAMGVPLATTILVSDLSFGSDGATIFQGSTMITYPPETIPGSDYVIESECQSFGSWPSDRFTIAHN